MMRIVRFGKSCAAAGAERARAQSRRAKIASRTDERHGMCLPWRDSLHRSPASLASGAQKAYSSATNFATAAGSRSMVESAEPVEMLAHLRRLVDPPHLGVELAHDRGGQVLRPGEPEPGVAAHVGKALLGKGRNVRIGRVALREVTASGTTLPALICSPAVSSVVMVSEM